MTTKHFSLILALAMILTTPFPAAAEEEVVIGTVEVRDGIYMLSGKGGNIGLFVGADGTFLIDDQFAPLTEKHLEAIRKAGGDTPRFLINTHYHADHTGGNENLGRAGALTRSSPSTPARGTRSGSAAIRTMRCA